MYNTSFVILLFILVSLFFLLMRLARWRAKPIGTLAIFFLIYIFSKRARHFKLAPRLLFLSLRFLSPFPSNAFLLPSYSSSYPSANIKLS